MSKIIVLDNLTIQKIAAGEIIERPSSVVKELVENSIDANAENIIIEIENGGKTLIRITDDGDGLDKTNLSLAFKRHSTSKLTKIEDIYNVMSLGFRGEALASISAVAKVEILTKTHDSVSGLKALVSEGEIDSIETIGCPKGTTIIVKDLFYNLPVRRKFLKNDLNESNHINLLINKLALGNPHISFKLIRDKKTILQTSATRDLKNTIHTVLGGEYSKNIFHVNYEDEYIIIDGYFSNNNLYRGNKNYQFIFVNNRYVINNGIARIIEGKYRSLIPIGKYPIFLLNINLAPKEIDVNIHPTKQEIEFINEERVFNSISDMLDNNVNSILRIPKLKVGSSYKEENTLPELFKESDTSEKSEQGDFKGIDFIDYNQYNLDSNYEGPITRLEENEVKSSSDSDFIENNFFNMDDAEIMPLGVVFNTYVVAELKGGSKIIFIDQHAAHERVMFERYKRQYENEAINSQLLIAPEIIELSTMEYNNFSDNKDLFTSLGFEIEEFGLNSIAIRSVPLLFGEPKLRSLFMDIFDSLNENIRSSYETKLERIMKIACTSAIKGGDQISNIEIKALFKDLMSCETPYTCPHGRPTVIELTKRDIEKQFLRII